MGDLSLLLPLLGTGMNSLAAFAGLAWKTRTCYFADLSVCGTQSVVVETMKVLWESLAHSMSPDCNKGQIALQIVCEMC